jgi:hypothetical protein
LSKVDVATATAITKFEEAGIAVSKAFQARECVGL